jgi:hypothetical protein
MEEAMNELHENTPDLSTDLRLLRQAIIRALAVAAHEHMRDNHWLYYFEALDRLLAPVRKALTTLTWELMESSSDTQEATEVAGSQPLKTEEGN